jgi:hypothetical protein
MTDIMIPLTIRDLTPEDLPWCGWSGSKLHLTSVAKELERARRGEVDYLAACPPSGLPVAINRLGYVAYGRAPDSWDEQAPDGTIIRYETVCTLMRKELP